MILQSSEYSGDSLQRLVLAAPSRRATLPAHHDLREPIRDHIAEVTYNFTNIELIRTESLDKCN